MQIGFLGDTNLSGCYKNTHESPSSGEVLEKFRTIDFLIANLEGPFLPKEQLKYGSKPVGSPKEKVVLLNLLGINVLNLANNHTMDAGTKGLFETLNTLKKHGLKVFGSGMNLNEASCPLILEKEGVRVALVGISMHEGQIASKSRGGIFGEGKEEALRKTLSIARNHADYIVLCHHGGIEYTCYPDPSRRRFYHKLSQMGIDVIVGTHTHTVQPYEVVGGVYIFYSLGNFIFDYPSHKHFSGTDESVLVILDFTHRGIAFNVFPLRQDFNRKKVVKGSIPSHFQELTESDYRNAWYRDARRLVKTRLKIPGRFPLPIVGAFRIVKMMKNRNLRSLLLGSIRHRS